MPMEQILWGLLGILLVFILNHFVGKLLWEFWGQGRRNQDDFIGRREHAMCTTHTRDEFVAIRQELRQIRTDNDDGHRRIYEKLDRILVGLNGKAPAP